MKNNFQIGDVVRISDSSPLMTIIGFGGYSPVPVELNILMPTLHSDEVECIWWDDEKHDFINDIFPIQCLQFVRHNVVPTNLQIGDVVQLASGSPYFAITSIYNGELSLVEVQHPEKSYNDFDMNLFEK